MSVQFLPPPFRDFTRAFALIGVTSFGGPAGQIALMHTEIVEDRGWIAEDDYLHALNFCHLLPGPEAQQLATYIGWKLHGIKGGLTAGLLFVIPGALVMLALSVLYAYAANLLWFSALFLGIKAAVLAIVVQALIRIAGRALGTRFKQALALIAFVGLFLLNLPFPGIIIGAGLLGAAVAHIRPDWLGLKVANADPLTHVPVPFSQTLRTIGVWLSIWATPMLILLVTLGTDHILWKIGLFFSQLAVVTFGGAYAVLAYMAQAAVQGFGWLRPSEMADGLGLAETTPGPLIMVTQFVGFLAAFRAPAPFSPLVAGFLGAALTTWVTFAPCFLWILTFAPWIDRLQHSTRLKGGLAAITGAVVGVIANLALWFSLHVLFRVIHDVPGHIPQVDVASLDWRAAILTALCAVLLFKLRWNVMKVLAVSALAGLMLGLN
jgi:chromate transporter